MSVERFLNQIRQQASLANSNRSFMSVGQITSYDPSNQSVQVQTLVATQDTPALQTGWIPYASIAGGNQTGVACGPNIGDLCLVFYQEGSLQNPIAGLVIANDNALPMGVPSGETWIINSSGSYVKLTNNGNILINGNIEIDISSPTININIRNDCNINANNVNINATNNVNLGDVSGTLHKLVNDTMINIYNTHTHNDPQGGVTGVPNQTLSSSNATQITQAN